MVKKVLVGGLFIIGGYFLIKKLLPSSLLSNNTDFDPEEYEVKESFDNRGGQKPPISINRNTSIDQVRDRRYYGQSMGSQQEIGSESPIGMGYVYGNQRKLYL